MPQIIHPPSQNARLTQQPTSQSTHPAGTSKQQGHSASKPTKFASIDSFVHSAKAARDQSQSDSKASQTARERSITASHPASKTSQQPHTATETPIPASLPAIKPSKQYQQAPADRQPASMPARTASQQNSKPSHSSHQTSHPFSHQS
jgi:hypothetical protein